MGALEQVPGVQNWVDRLPAGLLARWHQTIIYRCAKHLHFDRGMPVGKAIASSINWTKHIAATRDVKQWPGPQVVNPKSVAECVSALAVWAEMRATAKASRKSKTG